MAIFDFVTEVENIWRSGMLQRIGVKGLLLTFALSTPQSARAEEVAATTPGELLECSLPELRLFACQAGGEALSICVNPNLELSILQQMGTRKTAHQKVLAVEENVDATSAHGSSLVLRLHLHDDSTTIFATFSTFDGDSAAISDERKHILFCNRSHLRTESQLMAVNGKQQVIYLENLVALGAAKPLTNPPPFPSSMGH